MCVDAGSVSSVCLSRQISRIPHNQTTNELNIADQLEFVGRHETSRTSQQRSHKDWKTQQVVSVRGIFMSSTEVAAT